jgi:hypothetical protein
MNIQVTLCDAQCASVINEKADSFTPQKQQLSGNTIDRYYGKELCLKIKDNGSGISPL